MKLIKISRIHIVLVKGSSNATKSNLDNCFLTHPVLQCFWKKNLCAAASRSSVILPKHGMIILLVFYESCGKELED